MTAKGLLRFGLRAGRTWFGRLPRPYKLTFAITKKCNLRCASCNIWAQQSADELSLEEIDTFFSRNSEISWLDLTGGEVMLRPDFHEIIRSAARNLPCLFQFHFPTNGTFPERTYESTRVAVSLGFPKVVVSISIDGPALLHDELRSKSGTWDLAVETYERIKSIPRADAYFGMTLTERNLPFLFDTLDALASRIPGLRAKDLHLNLAHDTFYYGNPSITPLGTREVAEKLSRFMKLRGLPLSPILLLEWLYQRKIPEYLDTGTSPYPCEALSSSLFIAANGDIYPCSSYDRKLGNLRNMDFDYGPLWECRSTVELSRDIKHGVCPGCWTPCEAYQTIVACLPKPKMWRGHNKGAGKRAAR